MRVAILGGTGSFGRALAARLVAVGEDEVVIGSRDAARAPAAAAELGGARSPARRTRTPSRGADLAVLAVKADAALDTARAVAGALGDDAAALGRERARVRARDGVRPDPDARSPRRAHPGGRRRARSPPACTRSPRRTSTTRRPDEDALVCGDDAGGEGARARARRAGSSPAARSTPARSRARARSRG